MTSVPKTITGSSPLEGIIIPGARQNPDNYCSFLLPEDDYEKWMQSGKKAGMLCAFPLYHLYPEGSPFRNTSERVRYFDVLEKPDFPFGLPRFEEREDIRDYVGRSVNFTFRKGYYPKAFLQRCIAELLQTRGEESHQRIWDLMWLYNHSVFGIDANPIDFTVTKVAKEPRIPPLVLMEIREKMAKKKEKSRGKSF